MTEGRYNLDETDRALIKALTENARLPVATLAKRLGIARSTVQARLERLEIRGIIAGYTIRLGSAAQSSQLRATALLMIEPRATPTVLSRLKALPQIAKAYTTSGRFDLIVDIVASSTEELDQTLDVIGGVPGVKGSESLIHLTTRIDRSA